MLSHFASSASDVLAALNSDEYGLSVSDVQDRQKQFGANSLPQSGLSTTRLAIFVSQFKDVLMIILIVAGSISLALGEHIDATVIFITVGINALIGFFQEDKANESLKKLSQMVEYRSLVRRDGEEKHIDSTEIVPGDIVLLRAGDKVPADGRILEENEFRVNESSLTGESEPIDKLTKPVDAKAVIGDRKSMVYRGTTVLRGSATVVVTAIGTKTEIGTIAELVSTTKDEATPLQQELSHMSKSIAMIVIGICAAIFTIGLVVPSFEESLVELFTIAVAIAVAAIPEGLVISLTIILAIGMSFILKRKALVRKLVAAETLGSVSVICTDKTGTLTEGRMRVESIITAENHQSFDASRRKISDPSILRAIEIGVLANEGAVEMTEHGKAYSGDTTDTAFLQLGDTYKIDVADMGERIGLLSFSSETMYVGALYKNKTKQTLSIKGAPEVLLEKCTKQLKAGRAVAFSAKQRAAMQDRVAQMAAQGLRVIALATKDIKKKSVSASDVSGLTFVALAAIVDPLRSDVPETIQITKEAGIRTIMITGDHVRTAKYIGEQIGLPVSDDNIIDGTALAAMSDIQLAQIVQDASIFARVDPVHKIRIVQALQTNGEVVAMTGDGVNDAPALKGADIGVALGSGTDVAKETADIVLLDDSFKTIVAAIEEGRTLYQNAKKVVLYLLSGSFASASLVLVSMLLGLPLPVIAAQILWVNIVEDTFPNIALAFDKGDKENMKVPPRKKGSKIIDREMRAMIVAKSVLANVALFAIFLYIYWTTNDIALTRTVVFVGLGIDALFFIFAIRSLRHMVWQMPLLDNKYLLGAVGFGWIMLLTAVYWSPLQTLLRTVPLEAWHWGLMVGFGLFNLVLIETVKGLFLIRSKPHPPPLS